MYLFFVWKPLYYLYYWYSNHLYYWYSNHRKYKHTYFIDFKVHFVVVVLNVITNYKKETCFLRYCDSPFISSKSDSQWYHLINYLTYHWEEDVVVFYFSIWKIVISDSFRLTLLHKYKHYCCQVKQGYFYNSFSRSKYLHLLIVSVEVNIYIYW